jgi:tetratricopeptide (TPR) repeat protein
MKSKGSLIRFSRLHQEAARLIELGNKAKARRKLRQCIALAPAAGLDPSPELCQVYSDLIVCLYGSMTGRNMTQLYNRLAPILVASVKTQAALAKDYDFVREALSAGLELMRSNHYSDALLVFELALAAVTMLPEEPALSLRVSLLARAGICATKQRQLSSAERHINLGLKLCSDLRLEDTYQEAYLFEALSALLAASVDLEQEKLEPQLTLH